ncbi:MAG: hypothetical protein L6420_04575 [Elusimicrobia bacterium]|nr:hypothetical protein [Elusimicrobiota bacterium]
MTENFQKKMREMEIKAKRLTPPKKDGLKVDNFTRVYATWKGVYGTSTPPFSVMVNILEKFNALDLLQTLSKISFITQYKSNFEGKMASLETFENLVCEKAKEYIRKYSKHDISKICISRSQILFLQLMVFRYSREDGGQLSGRSLLEVGKLLFLSGSYCEGGRVADEDIEINHDAMMGNLVRNMVFNSSEQLRFKLPRYWHIFTKIQAEIKAVYPNEVFPIDEIIKGVTGSEPRDIIIYSFAILSYYFKDLDDMFKSPNEFLMGSDYFKNILPEKRAEADKRINNLSRTYAEFCTKLSANMIDGGYNPGPIYKTPLYKLSTNNFFLLDLKCLVDSCTEGLFWMVHDSTTRKANFRGWWGRLLKRYALHILRSFFPKTFLPPRLFVGDEEGFAGVDFIIIDPESAVFLEVTNSAIPVNKVLSTDWKEQKKSLNYILFETQSGKQGKAYKIAKAIREFKAGTLKLPCIDSKKIKKIFPVLVMERGFPQFPPIPSKIRKEIFEKTGMEEAEYFEIWDIEELESCQTVFREGASGFIERKHKEGYSDISMQNFLAAIKVDTSNDYATKIFEEATKSMRTLFHKKEN